MLDAIGAHHISKPTNILIWTWWHDFAFIIVIDIVLVSLAASGALMTTTQEGLSLNHTVLTAAYAHQEP